MISSIGEGTVIVGNRCKISPDVQIIFQRPSTVTIGDYCTLGAGVKIVCDGGDVRIGDWTSIHDRSLILSTAGVVIGQHGWFGQNCVLDGTGGLTIGNGVRVGMYSQIWSHVAAGEQIEGCVLYGTRPVVLEDDVWLVGSCVVASGVTIGRKTIALITSNITKSWPGDMVLAGSPAQPKDTLNFYTSISADKKWEMLGEWLSTISREHKLDMIVHDDFISLQDTTEYIIFVKDIRAEETAIRLFPNSTICTLSTKKYIKKLTDIEEKVLKVLSGNKARFLSRN